MLQIRNVVQQALSTGYLTVEAENQLRQMLTKKYDREDLKAFMALQQAAMTGQVRQQSRERLHLQMVKAGT
jgi:3-hydroxymyristoyl/3-hydroxydecanoyl-(acyl carrier protein) dehydratase